MAILEVNHIQKSFGKTEVLKDISFSLEKGQVVSIIGSSGSGKTTLLRCLNFLERPDSGQIKVNGEVLAGAKAVEMLNEAVEMFTLANNAKFFNEYGVMEISFKATNPFMETETAGATDYEAMVGESAATVTSKYTVNKETVDLTPGVGGENEAVTFKLVIKPVGSTGSDTGSEEQN
jgi:ABC-type polar amino acid transport system ATPase subunit